MYSRWSSHHPRVAFYGNKGNGEPLPSEFCILMTGAGSSVTPLVSWHQYKKSEKGDRNWFGMPYNHFGMKIPTSSLPIPSAVS